MIKPMVSFDPANPNDQNPFINNIQGQVGYLLIYNDSMITISINYLGYTRTIPAGMFMWLKLRQSTDFFNWAQVQIFPNVGQAPSSVVIIEGADASEADYVESLASPVALPRITNVGNDVPINTSSTSVVNDGNAVGTVVVEGTPLGAGSSQLTLKNDGTGFVGNGNLLIGATQLTVQNGYTIAPSALGTGVLGAGVTSTNFMLRAGDTMTGELILAKNQSAGDTEMLQIQPGNASPAARWTVNFTNGNSALKVIDNTNGAVAMIFYTNGQVGLTAMGTQGLSGVNTFAGAATGTYTHGLTQTPASISVLQKVLNATNTYGSDTYGSTTVHINVNSSPMAFVAISVL